MALHKHASYCCASAAKEARLRFLILADVIQCAIADKSKLIQMVCVSCVCHAADGWLQRLGYCRWRLWQQVLSEMRGLAVWCSWAPCAIPCAQGAAIRNPFQKRLWQATAQHGVGLTLERNTTSSLMADSAARATSFPQQPVFGDRSCPGKTWPGLAATI